LRFARAYRGKKKKKKRRERKRREGKGSKPSTSELASIFSSGLNATPPVPGKEKRKKGRGTKEKRMSEER